jgi:2-keto-3-deoxy-L-rhamnonate aldolase RhmA
MGGGCLPPGVLSFAFVADRAITLIVQLSTRPGSEPDAISPRALDDGASGVLIGVEQSNRAAVKVGHAARKRPNGLDGKNVNEAKRNAELRGGDFPLPQERLG